MRWELVMYITIIILLLSFLVEVPVPSFDKQMLTLCEDIVEFSEARAVSVDLPCELENGKLTYGNSSTSIGITHGVVVPNGRVQLP